jgi:hypothetical protein
VIVVATFEAPTVVAGLDDVTVVGQAVEQRGCHQDHPRGPRPRAAGTGPLQLTRRHDLLDIDIAPPDLNAYEVNDHDPE